jgi:hypothetical protein
MIAFANICHLENINEDFLVPNITLGFAEILDEGLGVSVAKIRGSSYSNSSGDDM